MDVGTGGGFPGIPLAILFPECKFFLVDSIGKKIKVVDGVKEALGLDNVVARQMRVEEVKEKYDAYRQLGNYLDSRKKKESLIPQLCLG